MEHTHLKPCPFCGNQHISVCCYDVGKKISKISYYRAYVHCVGCGIDGPKVYREDENTAMNEAEALWNKRV